VAWNVVGCLEVHWNEGLMIKIQKICEDGGNVEKIYRRCSSRALVTREMYLLGPPGRPLEAQPTVFVLSSDSRIAKRTASLLRDHDLLKSYGFEYVTQQRGVPKLLVGINSDTGTRRQLPDTGSLCGSRIIVSTSPISTSSQWRQCTLGGVVAFGGLWYGVTVAHAFFELNAIVDVDSDTDCDDSDIASEIGEGGGASLDEVYGTCLSNAVNEPQVHGIYLETDPPSNTTKRIPSTPLFRRTESDGAISFLGHFKPSSTQSIHQPATHTESWSSEMDWALLVIHDPRFMVPNVIRTAGGDIIPSLSRGPQARIRGRAIVAAGSSGVFETTIRAGTAAFTLPWSKKVHQASMLDCTCGRFPVARPSF
jgi:hypothetical protein